MCQFREAIEMMSLMDALVAFALPLGSTFLGAGITYWINVRNRRQTKREDVFHEAIGAVAVVEASRVTLTGMPPWDGASTEAGTAARSGDSG